MWDALLHSMKVATGVLRPNRSTSVAPVGATRATTPVFEQIVTPTVYAVLAEQ